MSLDLFTVTVMTALSVWVACIAFILETVVRRDTGPGRLWAAAFFSGLTTTVAYMAWSSGLGGPFSVAAGNAMFVLVPGFMWLGSRRFNDRPGRTAMAIVIVAAVVVFVASVLQAPSMGSWGGWPAMAAGIVALSGAAGVETLRSPMRRIRSAWVLSATLLFAALYYAVRFVVFFVQGPEGPIFTAWLGSISANFVTVVLTVVAAIVLSVLRSQRTIDRRYEWLTEGGVGSDGVMLARTFGAASADLVQRAQWRDEGVTLVVIRVEGLGEIRTAFGPAAADAVTGACRLAVRRYAPASALVGEDGDDRLAVCAVAATAADARRLGAMIYRGCMEELSADQSGLFPFVGVGVAFTADVGYDRVRLQEGARDAARRAAETPGASVVIDAPAPSE